MRAVCSTGDSSMFSFIYSVIIGADVGVDIPRGGWLC
jgi:hypothetical protein